MYNFKIRKQLADVSALKAYIFVHFGHSFNRSDDRKWRCRIRGKNYYSKNIVDDDNYMEHVRNIHINVNSKI